MDKLLIIDGSSLLTSSYYGTLPSEVKYATSREEKEANYSKLLKSHDGLYTNAINSFLSQFFALTRKLQPKYIAVCWDVGRDKTFRRKLYPEYKAQRANTEYPLKEQLIHAQQLLKFINIPCFMSEEYEADDFAGSIGNAMATHAEIIYVTKDMDYLQLITPTASVYALVNNSEKLYETLNLPVDKNLPSNMFEYNMKTLKLLKGLSPEQIVDLKALAGDKSDNVPGIPGVGENSAIQLLKGFYDIETLYEFLHHTPEDKAVAKVFKEKGISRVSIDKVRKGEDSAILSKQLCAIRKDLIIDIDINSLVLDINENKLVRILTRLDFNVERMLNKLH